MTRKEWKTNHPIYSHNTRILKTFTKLKIYIPKKHKNFSYRLLCIGVSPKENFEYGLSAMVLSIEANGQLEYVLGFHNDVSWLC